MFFFLAWKMHCFYSHSCLMLFLNFNKLFLLSNFILWMSFCRKNPILSFNIHEVVILYREMRGIGTRKKPISKELFHNMPMSPHQLHSSSPIHFSPEWRQIFAIQLYNLITLPCDASFFVPFFISLNSFVCYYCCCYWLFTLLCVCDINIKVETHFIMR